MNRRHAPGHAPARQRGLATLVVVMVLFFIVSLVAAYTSRNLIFEQKTSANQARGTLAFEAAEAGVEWALTQLNGGKVREEDCIPDALASKSFAQRYLSIVSDRASGSNGFITHPSRNGNWPTCVFNGNDWLNCKCPDNTELPVTPPVGFGVFPAFRVWLAAPGPLWLPPTPVSQLMAKPGLVNVQSVGCTRLPAPGDPCLDFAPLGEIGDGLATVRAMLALRSGLHTPPAAAVTARGSVSPDASVVPKLRVVNADAASNGFTIHAGGAIASAQIAAESLPGTPGELSQLGGDPKLVALSTVSPITVLTPLPMTAGERMFAATFGMKRQTYRQQTGLRVCPAPPAGPGECSAAEINALMAANPNRVVWVRGDLVLNANIGSVTAPVLLIVDGQTLTLGAAGGDITGLVYITGGAASADAEVVLPNAARSLRGALIAESGLVTRYAAPGPSVTSLLAVVYDADVLNLLRTTYGTWVRVPGSWKDFRDTP